MADNTITVRELAVLLGSDLSYCYHLLYAGRVLGEQVNGRWRVDRASAFDYARRKKARQEKKKLRDERKAERRAELARRTEEFQALLQKRAS